MATHVLTESMGETITMDDFKPALAPGDTVIISPDRTTAIKLYEIVGSSGLWITVTNPSDSKITLSDGGSINAAIRAEGCRYMHLVGNNYGSETYGMRLTGTSSFGLGIVNTSDIEVAHLEIDTINDVGLGYSQCWAPWSCVDTEIMENVTIHHNHIHDVGGEGMYFGKSSRVPAPKFEDIQIHHNIVQDCGWDGIQLAQTQGNNNNIYNNTVIHTGHGGTLKWCWATEQNQIEPCQGQWFGIVIGVEHHGVHIYRNYVEDSYDTGISVVADGDGPIDIHDNVIWKAGGNGIGVGNVPGTSTIINNTVVDSTKYGISTYSGNTPGELLYNLLIANGFAGINSGYTNQHDNRVGSSIAKENFVNASIGNFRLTIGSPAKDAGIGAGYSPTDFDGTIRPFGSAADIGAFEYIAAEALAEGRIVNLDHPASVENGAMCDINAAIKNIGELSGRFKTQILIDSILLVTSPEFTLAGGATSTDKIDPFKAPSSGESMDITIKCIRSE